MRTKMTRRSALLSLTATAFVGTIALATVSAVDAAEYTFRLGHPMQPSDETQTAMLFFADNVKKATQGRVEITVFPVDQLGRHMIATSDCFPQSGKSLV